MAMMLFSEGHIVSRGRLSPPSSVELHVFLFFVFLSPCRASRPWLCIEYHNQQRKLVGFVLFCFPSVLSNGSIDRVTAVALTDEHRLYYKYML